jgi:predicted PurR-regulated permease PerM
LGFLIVIHKLEYYVNAKIVGHEIKTSIWEMLIIMVLMETIFGLIGVAVAPIIYGYIKEELEQKGLI